MRMQVCLSCGDIFTPKHAEDEFCSDECVEFELRWRDDATGYVSEGELEDAEGLYRGAVRGEAETDATSGAAEGDGDSGDIHLVRGAPRPRH